MRRDEWKIQQASVAHKRDQREQDANLRSKRRIGSNLWARALLLSLLASTLWLLATPLAARTGNIIGDANGDGRFNGRDVTAAVTSLRHQSERKVPLADVAEPCDGRIRAQDGLRLLGAMFLRRESRTMTSRCHDGNIGEPVPSTPALPRLRTMDDQFLSVARAVPEFGGFYMRGDELRVVLTDPSPTVLHLALERIRREFGADRLRGLTPVAVLGEYGFTELGAWKSTSMELLSRGLVVSVDADEVANRITLGLRDLDERDVVSARLARRGVPQDALRFVQRRPFELQDLKDELQKRQRPLIGGLFMESSPTRGCSLGFLAKWWGSDPVFLTNSHCLAPIGQNNGVVVFQDGVDLSNPGSNTNDDQIGVEALDPPLGCGFDVPCRASDAAMIGLDNDETGRLGFIGGSPGTGGSGSYFGRYEIVGKGQAFCGDTVISIGAITGERWGEVLSTCVGVLVDSSTNPGSPPITQFTCQTLHEDQSQNGNSGGPVVRLVNGASKVELVGLHSQFLDGVGGYSPISNIESEIGVLDVVAQNEPPHVRITAPLHGENVGSGAFLVVHLDADVRDFEEGGDCAGCMVNWYSAVDGGNLGSSDWVGGTSELNGVLSGGPGYHAITATVYDSEGASEWDTIVVVSGSTPPAVWIDAPINGADLFPSTPYQFSGSSFDNDTFFALACDALEWTSSYAQDTDFPVTGCFPVVSFTTLGTRQITLTGRDEDNLVGQAAISIDVVDPGPNAPLVVTFLEPGPNTLRPAEEWVTVKATATQVGGSGPIEVSFYFDDGAASPQLMSTVTIVDGEQAAVTFRPEPFLGFHCGTASYKILVVARRGLIMTSKSLPLGAGYPPC